MDSTTTISVFVGLLGLAGYLCRFFLPFPPPNVIGVDLGTSFSSLAIFNNGFGNITIIAGENGKNLVPSVVTFYKNGTFEVGSIPSADGSIDSVTFYDSKRFIGRTNVKSDEIKAYPFDMKVIDGKAYYVLPEDFNSDFFGSRSITPAQISSLILLKMKQIFKRTFGRLPAKAVIGVPVEFNQQQREHTVMAATMAKLEVLRLVNEPTAASVACDVQVRPEVEYVVVLDLGGGTFDVSVLYSSERSLSTLAIAGNDRLGGRDFTEVLARCVLMRIGKAEPNLSQNERGAYLRVIEGAKINLSDSVTTQVSFIVGGKTYSVNISTDDFETCTAKLFEKLVTPIDRALEAAKVTADNVHEIVLVGGATRMPRVWKMATQYFGREPNKNVDPDTAVVIGLANQAGIMSQGWPLEKAAIDILPQNLSKIKSD